MSENLRSTPKKIIFVFDNFSEFEIPGEYLSEVEIGGLSPVKTGLDGKSSALTFGSFRCDIAPSFFPNVVDILEHDTNCDFITYMENNNEITQIIISENNGDTISYYVGDNYQQDYMVSSEGTCILIKE